MAADAESAPLAEIACSTLSKTANSLVSEDAWRQSLPRDQEQAASAGATVAALTQIEDNPLGNADPETDIPLAEYHEDMARSDEPEAKEDGMATLLNESDGDDDSATGVTMVRPMPSLRELGFGREQPLAGLQPPQATPSRTKPAKPMTLELLLDQQALELEASPD
jgi:hypothetical protein